MTDEGSMEEHLGIMIEHNKDSTFRMSQPHLKDRIIATLPNMIEARSTKSPASPGIILSKDSDVTIRKAHCHYRYIIGIVNFLVNYTRPE